MKNSWGCKPACQGTQFGQIEFKTDIPGGKCLIQTHMEQAGCLRSQEREWAGPEEGVLLCAESSQKDRLRRKDREDSSREHV